MNPAKEVKLSYFLDTPIDSRYEAQIPDIPNDCDQIQNMPGLNITKPLQKIIKMKNENVEDLKRDWARRFANFSVYKHNHNPSQRSHSHRQLYKRPTLVQRQIRASVNPSRLLTIEEISNMRRHQVQGPSQQLSHLPRLRCIPMEFQNKNIKKALRKKY